MDPFVLVHGAWHGAWCWDATASALERRGHRAFAPQLRGLGENEAASGPASLADHVNDVVNYIDHHDLIDVTLVGVNVAGGILPMVFDAIPVRIDGVIFIDGLIPLPGESVADAAEIVFPDARAAWERAAEGGDALPPDDALLDWMLAEVPEPGRAEARARLRPHPLRALLDPAAYHAFPSAPPYRAYIRCQKTPFTHTGARMAQRAQASLHPLAAGHDAMLSHPETLASRLLEIVATWNSGDTP